MIKKILTITSAIVIFPHVANAQTTTYYPPGTYSVGTAPNAYNTNTISTPGYLNGGIDPITTIRNAQTSQQSPSNTTNTTSADNNPDKNLVPGWSALEDNSTTEKSSATSSTENSENKDETVRNSQQTAEERNKEIKRLRDELEGNQTNDNEAKNKADPSSSKPLTASNNGYVVKGRAVVLDSITLAVNGTIFSLNNLKGPGNGQICYRSGMPWACGEDGRHNLESIVSGQQVACHVIGRKGICLTDTGGDVVRDVVRSGFAIPTKEDNGLHKKDVLIARQYERGLFQK